MTPELINIDQLAQHHKKLLNAVCSGTHILEGQPFQPHCCAMFAEFGIWKPEFFNALQAILQLPKANNALYIVKTINEAGQTAFVKGHALEAKMDWKTYNALGFDLDFIGNGAEHLLFDDTYQWCVGTIVDVHYIAGNKEILHCFYPKQTDWDLAKKDFVQFVQDSSASKAYQAMTHYISEF